MLAEVLEVEYYDLGSVSMTGRLSQILGLFFSATVLGSVPFQLLRARIKIYWRK